MGYRSPGRRATRDACAGEFTLRTQWIYLSQGILDCCGYEAAGRKIMKEQEAAAEKKRLAEGLLNVG